MTIELTLGNIASFCGAVIALAGLIKLLIEAKKAVSGPYEEMNKKLKKQDERIEALEDEVMKQSEDNRQMLTTLKLILKHMRTGNNTGEMQDAEDALDEYIINR